MSYRSLRDYWRSNEYKFEEVFQEFCNSINSSDGEKKQQSQVNQPQKIALSKVKNCCDRILNREISRNCWASWKQYLEIPKYEQFVDEAKASLLTYMACWRHDHPTKKFPSINRLITMMKDWSRRAMTLETTSSAKMWLTWNLRGCKGRDLHKYLAACGYKVSTRTLYKWGDFSLRRHYSVSELAEWREKASKKRLVT